jgi:hypothetical protein
MIRYFSLQALHVRNGRSGQAMVLFLVVVCTVMTLLFASIAVHSMMAAKVACANAVDAIALNAATWEARCLNLISALNEGISHCMTIIRWVIGIWAGLAIAAAFGVGLPPFIEYTRYAREIISDCWDTARMFASWSENIRKMAPYLVLGETIALADRLDVIGMLHPFDPRGPHDGKNTLELHLEKGPPISILNVFDPISSVIRKINKIKVRNRTGRMKNVRNMLNSAINFLIGGNTEPIHMLIPEKDFNDRQFVRFVGSREHRPLPIPFLGNNETERLLDEAAAEPYGGGAESMTWKSRLTKREVK